MNKEFFGIQLAYCRKMNGWTQEKLADKVGCWPSTISRIETGKEYPRVELFEKLNAVFHNWGVNGPDVFMDDVSKLKDAEYELLVAIHKGRLEQIDRALKNFGALMDDNNISHQQYYCMGALACMRKRGISPKEFRKECIRIFNMGRKMPSVEAIPKLSMSRIEHMILFQYAMVEFELGESEIAEGILVSLMKNCFIYTSEYNRRRCKSISTNVAKVYFERKEYKKAQDCICYTLERFLDANDSRLVYQILDLQQKIFNLYEDKVGAELIDDFFKSAARMINYLYKQIYSL